jgi:ATP-dependent Lhr-like helicase
MSTSLADRVRTMIQDRDHWRVLPPDVQEWLEMQAARSVIPDAGTLLVETFARGTRHYLIAYPFEGGLAHATLCMLLTRRLDRLGVGPLGFVCTDYSLAIWSIKPMEHLDLDALFEPDMLGDDLESWLAESFMMKRTFRNCALISGLIEKRQPGSEKSGRQVTFSTDLIYDVLRRHQPDHLLLQTARADADPGPDPACAAGAPLAILRAGAGPDRARTGWRRAGGGDDPRRLGLQFRRRSPDRRGDGVREHLRPPLPRGEGR